MFNEISHYNFQIQHISGENNIPADVLSRMPNTSAELPDVDHFIPVQIVEIKAVQTRGGKLRISRDLVEMADRAKKDDDYQELIRKVTGGVNFENLEEDDPHKVYKDKWQDLRILTTIAGNLV